MDTVAFTVHGTPAPAGSKKAFYNARLGRSVVVDANAKARPWKALVSDAASQAVGDMLPFEGPVLVEMTFWMPRPKSHYGTGRNAGVLKATAPRFHTSAPDALKLARGVEDAMQGLVYRNDSQIVVEILQKPYGDRPRCDVRVGTIEADIVDSEFKAYQERVARESSAPATLFQPELEKGEAGPMRLFACRCESTFDASGSAVSC